MAHPLLDDEPSQITQKLNKALVKPRHYHSYFLPKSQLAKIVTDDVIENELSRPKYSMANGRKLSTAPEPPEAYNSYRKIFAILGLMKQTSELKYFVESRLCDHHLPFNAYPNDTEKCCGLRSRQVDITSVVRLRNEGVIDEFLEQQWSVLVPTFDGPQGSRIPHSDLDSGTILPLLTRTYTIKTGGSGRVLRAEIHPDHHSLIKGCNVYAIKVLNSTDERDFKQEVTILEKLSSERHAHPHLITLLATYRYGGSYHLIFPWAETDLFGYWQRSKTPPLEDNLCTWVVEQCHGLAEALNRIHRYETFSGTSLLEASGIKGCQQYQSEPNTVRTDSASLDRPVKNLFGRHGDLKPENILWFPDAKTTGGHGILKITDFGITRFNTENMWDTWRTGHVPNSPSYRSPECDLDRDLTVACDVWALGCVYLEFITWYFGGYEYFHEFAKSRLEPDSRYPMKTDTFFTIYEESGVRKAEVKEAVLKMFDELKEHQRCSPDFRGFIDIIQRDMLVVNQDAPNYRQSDNAAVEQTLSASLSVPDSARRKSCGHIYRALGSIKRRYDQEEEEYLTRQDTHEPRFSSLRPTYFPSFSERLARAPTLLRQQKG